MDVSVASTTVQSNLKLTETLPVEASVSDVNIFQDPHKHQLSLATVTDVSSPTPEYAAAALTSFWAKLIAHDSTLVDCSIANEETVKAAMAFFKAF
jgi:hypothetical protein